MGTAGRREAPALLKLSLRDNLSYIYIHSLNILQIFKQWRRGGKIIYIYIYIENSVRNIRGEIGDLPAN